MSVTLAPDDIVATHAEGAANEREPLLVLEPLRAFLRAGGLDAPANLSAVPIGEGHSNVTFGLSTGVVLRRPPRGPLPPSAHNVLREAQLLSALEPTTVRTPRVLAVCDDLDVIGAPFYVMEHVNGTVITDAVPAALDTPAHRRRIAEELVDSLVELHATDWTTLGLEGFGRPTGYLERQLRRFNGLWEVNRTREIEELDAVGTWLANNMPESPPSTIVHGDYRLGNTMFATQAPPRLTAILDWEMATIGDPLADIGYLLIHWVQSSETRSRFVLHAVTGQPGFPTRQEMVARYEQVSGRSVSSLDWYVTLAMWKAAVFMEGNYKRAVLGTTDDPFLKTFGEGVLELAQRALDVTRNGVLMAFAGLLVDWGGVMTTDVFASFRAFCEEEGLSPDAVGERFRTDRASRDLLIGLETGTLPEADFEQGFAAILGVSPGHLIERMFAGGDPDPLMHRAVRRARDAGVRTGLISNSWGTSRYDRALLAELFDGVVISGEVGVRKPTPEIYERGARAIDLAPDACVFVDDLTFNLKPARALGMATVHHTDAEQTIEELERLLAVALT